MTDKMRESLSAVMDGEADELELQRVLRQIGEDEPLRQTWMRYHAASVAVSGQAVTHVHVDISSRVRAALDDNANARSAEPRWQAWKRPLASIAVAASVAATVVLGGQQLATLGGAASIPEAENVATGVSPVGMVNSFGATSVQASFGTRSVPVLQPATRTAYHELARQRMSQYSQMHAEQAALNTPQGLLPFARVERIKE